MDDIADIEARLNSPDEDERLRAVLDLGGSVDPERIKKLVEVLEREGSRAVREAAAVALISIGTEEVAEEVARLLRSGDPYARNTASDILQCIGEPAEGVLAGLLSDPDPDVRSLAVRAVGRGDLRSAVRLLREVVLSDGDINVVASAAEFLGVKGETAEDAEALRAARQRFSDPFLDFVVDEALEKMRAVGGIDG
ncbi:MAG: HEAT repeat domain-containing protein [Thermacetogeniaceae bacterium]